MVLKAKFPDTRKSCMRRNEKSLESNSLEKSTEALVSTVRLKDVRSVILRAVIEGIWEIASQRGDDSAL